MKSALLLLVCAFAVCGGSQRSPEREDGATKKVTELTAALVDLRNSPDDRTAQARYLEAFPKTYKEYLQLFDKPPLSDCREYLDVFLPLASNHELAVGNLLVNLSQDARYDSDAPSCLQHATARYAGQHARVFASLLKRLPSAKEANLITFLADAENHDAYSEYQPIIDHLKALGETALARKFERARTKRKQQPHG